MLPTPEICLAPMRGITNATYRTLFVHHFTGLDQAMAPFIPTVKPSKSGIKASILEDVMPHNNTDLPLVPQVIGNNASDFILMANTLSDLGYKEINWNLGCPWPQVVKKCRGSGLLVRPDLIDSFLKDVTPSISCKLSIKIRIGLNDSTQALSIIPIINSYPVSELIIHPRTAVQMYDGTVDLAAFEKYLQISEHPVVYNGDITSTDVFHDLQARFPSITRWMIGRGLISDPFLAAEIKAEEGKERNKARKIQAFHDDLVSAYQTKLSGEKPVLGKMKETWLYMSHSFKFGKKLLKKVQLCQSLDDYNKTIRSFFDRNAEWTA